MWHSEVCVHTAGLKFCSTWAQKWPMAVLWKEHKFVLHLQASPVIRCGLAKRRCWVTFSWSFFFHWRSLKDIFPPLVEKCFVSLWRTSEMHNDEVRKKYNELVTMMAVENLWDPLCTSKTNPAASCLSARKMSFVKKKKKTQIKQPQEILHCLSAEVWELLSWSSHCIFHASVFFFSQH